MKCSACGEENAQNARFCSFCWARLNAASPDEEEKKEEARADEEAEQATPEAQTAQPLSDNPYQPRRMPTIYADGASQPAQAAREPLHTALKTPKVFLFDDEKEEEEAREREAEKARQAARRQIELERRAEEDPFFDEDDEDDDDDDYDDDEESSGRGRKVFAIVISVVTVLILAVAALAFLFYTPTGSRLRAYYGMASSAEDYVYLADWQLQNGNNADAAASYYNAFLLNREDYDFALTIAQKFEQCGANERAEQMYMYLIDRNPLESDPYDYLMALLVREGKNDEYLALIDYRAQRQPGYVAPVVSSESIAAPTASPAAGNYTGSVHITLSAEDGASIYFTVDGTEPNTSSRLYSGPVILYSGSYTLKAVAVVNGAMSEVFSAIYVVS